MHANKPPFLYISPDYQDCARRICDEYPDIVNRYMSGKIGLLGFLVGEVIKDLRGTADPRWVNESIVKELEYRKSLI
jgi:aspartyl-tRNA(Asn)/glutamyl-tRNA(Gln) amidotransferase subunit B